MRKVSPLLVLSAIAWLLTVVSLVIEIGVVWYMYVNCPTCLYAVKYTIDNCSGNCYQVRYALEMLWKIFACLLMVSVVIEIVRFLRKDCDKDDSHTPLFYYEDEISS